MLKFRTTANALRAMRKANPRLIIDVWKHHIVDVYESQIEEGDINFFITKEYSKDVAGYEGKTTF